jgi:hypothetical protein
MAKGRLQTPGTTTERVRMDLEGRAEIPKEFKWIEYRERTGQVTPNQT